MGITSATATEMQNNFGKYLTFVMSGGEVVVTKNGKEVGRLMPKNTTANFLTDSLTGILKEEMDINNDNEKNEYLRSKYGFINWCEYYFRCSYG